MKNRLIVVGIMVCAVLQSRAIEAYGYMRVGQESASTAEREERARMGNEDNAKITAQKEQKERTVFLQKKTVVISS